MSGIYEGAETPLFPASDAWNDDPINPGLEWPTPPEIIASLTRPQREQRVYNLTRQAHAIHQQATALAGGKDIVATVILYSGGNDSTLLAHLFKDTATHAAHANTGIGVEDTRQFVRDTCQAWGLPLLEKHPPTSYRDLVIERGFPGPQMHFKMYQRLKERCLEQVRNELVSNYRRQRVVFLAGRRRAESARRADIPLHERKGSVIWASPLALWTKLDMNTYRLMHPDIPRNPVADTLGMSGECLCGAFAKPGEIDRIAEHYPDTAREIHDLEAEVEAAGHSLCTWGHGRGEPSTKTGPLCTSCHLGKTDPLWDLLDQGTAA